MTGRKRKAGTRKLSGEPAQKEAILEAALAHAPFDGFSEKTLSRAAADSGVEKSALPRLFPLGPQSLVEFYSDWADFEMEARLGALDLKSMKVRERIRTAVRTRLAILGGHKEAARRAAAFLSLPPNLFLATKLLYRAVDAMWRATGDTSTDFNFYTKRAILAAVWSSTLMRWFNDQSQDGTETDEFLAARIENVMQFEKLKAQAKDALAKAPSPLGFLSGLAPRR
jgi:ubiquinone biosynthesis protein COQ9